MFEKLNKWHKIAETTPPYRTAVICKRLDGEPVIGYYCKHREREDMFYTHFEADYENLIEGEIVEWKPI